MTRVFRSPPTTSEWLAVSGKNPCPICASVDGQCSENLEGTFAACSRTPSDWLLTNGTWLHATPVPEERHEDEEVSLADQISALGSSVTASNA